MRSHPTHEQVFADLGDKALGAFYTAVVRARKDLTTYRTQFPAWVAEASERGLANWIHDRLWYHLTELLDGIEDVILVDKEPNRSIAVGVNYKLRMKRHHQDGAVSTYPTETAIEFMAQDEPDVLDGMVEVRLIAGYRWEPTSREIGEAVVSLRDGKDCVIWIQPVPGDGLAEGGTVVEPSVPGPSRPSVDASPLRRDDAEENDPE